MKHWLLFTLFLCHGLISSAQFAAGDEVQIDQTQADDCYFAGGQVSVDAPIQGDLIIAGGQLTVTDSVAQDLVVAGGEIRIDGVVGDDIRAAGGQLTLSSHVHDDVILFGGSLDITSGTVIEGNLIVFGGEVRQGGTVLGATEIRGGEVEVSGYCFGSTTLASGQLVIQDGAEFHGPVTYWTESGEMDFGGSLMGVRATYDDSMAFDTDSDAGPFLGAGFAFFWIAFLVSGFIFLIGLNWAFHRAFSDGSGFVLTDIPRSLGYGLIYLLGVPILIVLTFIIIVGIPIGLLMLLLFGFSLFFSVMVFSLLLSHAWGNRSADVWGFWKQVFIAFILSIGIHLLTFIPFIGGLLSFILITWAYGAMILGARRRNQQGGVVYA